MCSQCKKSFDASYKLECHIKATKHFLHCVQPGFTTTCTTPAGLAPRVDNNYSVEAQSTTSALAVQQSNRTTPKGAPLFLCTHPDCFIPFKTKSARKRHLSTATHGKRVTATNAQQSSEVLSDPRVIPVSITVQSGASASVMAKEHHIPATRRKAQPGQNLASQKASAAAASQGPGPKPSNLLTKKPLYSWDSRWSAIPATQHAIIYSALASIALTAKPDLSDLPWKDKKFYTPDVDSACHHNPKAPKHQAIVLDCEMVGVGHKGLTSELARVSAIDFFTGGLLVDTLVEPHLNVTDWRTQWSGITAKDMNEAIISGEALRGSTAARKELFRYMDSQTILVGHSLQFDLAALGIHHDATADSSILARLAVGRGFKRQFALKTLCKELLNITVQDHGKNGHDAVEDALAAREVVLWCLQHEAELKSWGKKKKKEHFTKPQKKRPAVPTILSDEDDSDESELLCLSTMELNELCYYPEWYNNWD